MRLPDTLRKASFWITASAIILASAFIAAKFPAGDFAVYYSSGLSLLDGRTDLYSPDFANGPVMDFRYPPGSVLLFLPLALLTYPAAKFTFSALTLFLACAAVKTYWESFKQAGPDNTQRPIILILSILLCLKYFLMSMRVLNVHLIVLCLLTLSFVYLLRNRTQLAAGLMALGISIKVFPLVSLPFFAIGKKWRFLLLTAAFGAAFVVLPSLYFGLQKNIELHREWVDHVLRPSPFMELNRPPNQSVFGMLERLLTDMKYEDRAGDRDYPKIHVTEFDPETVKTFGWLAAGMILIVTFSTLYLVERSMIDSWSGPIIFYEFGLVLCMMLIVGPWTNRIYPVALFIPATVLLHSVIVKRSVVAWVAVIPMVVASIIVPLVPGAKISRWAHVIGFDFFAPFAAWVGLLIILITWRTKSNNTPSTA